MAALALLAAPLEAQRRIERLPVARAAAPIAAGVAAIRSDTVLERHGKKVLGAILGGGVGMIAGAYLGAYIGDKVGDDCYEDCWIPGFLIGGAVGEGLGFGAGMHLFDRQDSKLLRRMVGPAAISGGALAVALATGSGWWLLPVVPLQFVIAF